MLSLRPHVKPNAEVHVSAVLSLPVSVPPSQNNSLITEFRLKNKAVLRHRGGVVEIMN
jgi:hypothetical protein